MCVTGRQKLYVGWIASSGPKRRGLCGCITITYTAKLSPPFRCDIDGAMSAVDSLASIAGAPADGGSSDSDLQLEVALRHARTLLQAKRFPEVRAVALQGVKPHGQSC